MSSPPPMLGNATEAARRLNVSQPSVSAAIAEVESFVGVPLFIRHHARGVTLTLAGEKIINEARLLLKHAAEFQQNALDYGNGLRGRIAVGCFLTLAARFMPALLANFAKRQPGIDVELSEGDQEELIAMLLSGRTELALAYDFALHPDLIARAARRPAAARHRCCRASPGRAGDRQPQGAGPGALHPARPAAFARLLLRPLPQRRRGAARHVAIAFAGADPRPRRQRPGLLHPERHLAHQSRLRRQARRRAGADRAAAADAHPVPAAQALSRAPGRRRLRELRVRGVLRGRAVRARLNIPAADRCGGAARP